MTLCINNNLWDKGQRSEIINTAVDIHLEKRRKMMDQEKEPEVKKTLYDPFSWMGFNCLKVRATLRRQFTFYHINIDLGRTKKRKC